MFTNQHLHRHGDEHTLPIGIQASCQELRKVVAALCPDATSQNNSFWSNSTNACQNIRVSGSHFDAQLFWSAPVFSFLDYLQVKRRFSCRILLQSDRSRIRSTAQHKHCLTGRSEERCDMVLPGVGGKSNRIHLPLFKNSPG